MSKVWKKLFDSNNFWQLRNLTRLSKSSIIIIYEKSTLLTVPFSASSRWLCGQIMWSSSRTSLTASIRRSTRLCLRYIETSINAAANWVINTLVHFLTIDMLHSCWILNLILQFTESSEALQKDVSCNKSKEHFLTAIRTLELMQVKVAFETSCEHLQSNKKFFFSDNRDWDASGNHHQCKFGQNQIQLS